MKRSNALLFATAHFRSNPSASVDGMHYTEYRKRHRPYMHKLSAVFTEIKIPSIEFFSGMLTSLRWEKPKCNRKFTVSSHGDREMNSLLREHESVHCQNQRDPFLVPHIHVRYITSYARKKDEYLPFGFTEENARQFRKFSRCE